MKKYGYIHIYMTNKVMEEIDEIELNVEDVLKL